jgi:hypothetical protein
MKFVHLGTIAIFTFAILTFSILELFDFRTEAKQYRLYCIFAQSKTCDIASSLAEQDFKQGNYLLIHWGMPDDESILINETLNSGHKLEQMYGGCIFRDKVECYNETMRWLLQQKYGYQFHLPCKDKKHLIYLDCATLRCESL